MSTIRVTKLLRNVLLLDAGCTAVTGVLLSAGHPVLPGLLGLPPAFMLGTGLFCLAWAVGLGLLSRRPATSRALVRAIIAANLLWAVGSFVLLGLGWLQPTSLGVAFVALQAAAVAVFAELQWWALKRGSAPAGLRTVAA
ncbi:MAG: hypothetical protein EPO01_02175 [Aquabacterium sp.]|nr:MAG: hypothetical protein EPO01_02175 [Aquabacterium sp.]